MRPNIVLIVFDTARADAFEPYGAPAGRSPAVSGLASAGISRDEVFAPSSWTLPSHASIFTGLLPGAAGPIGLPGQRPDEAAAVLRARAGRLLPEVLRRTGYDTRAVSANLWISAQSGFDTGFDEFLSVVSERQAKLHSEGWRQRLGWAAEALRAGVDDGALRAESVIRRWADAGLGGEPFFWFVNLVECHSPYLPPKPYNDLGPLERLRAADEAREHLNLGAIWRACAGGFDIPAEALERMRHLYARSIRYMDDWLSRVLERLDEARILEETIVIVTSDHGENFGEGELITHALSLDDRLIKVPLVAAGPGITAEALELRSLAELPRAIAGLAGLDDHPWSPDDLPPTAAVAEIEPPAYPSDQRIHDFAELHGLGEAGLRRLTTPQRCATDGRLKLLRRGDEDVVFDLISDPLELTPVRINGSERDGIDSERLAALVSAIGAAEELTARHRLGEGEAPAEAGAPSPEELLDLEERMRLLGYL